MVTVFASGLYMRPEIRIRVGEKRWMGRLCYQRRGKHVLEECNQMSDGKRIIISDEGRGFAQRGEVIEEKKGPRKMRKTIVRSPRKIICGSGTGERRGGRLGRL